jgi:biopolymer transport protein ExbD
VQFKRTRKPLLNLESVALTDIIMNLFIFFFITFSFLATFNKTKESRTHVELPAGVPTEGETTQTLVVTMTAAAELFLDEKPLSLDELRQRLRAARHEGSNLALVLRADAGSMHGRVVEVLEAARADGVENLSVATRGQETPAPSERP